MIDWIKNKIREFKSGHRRTHPEGVRGRVYSGPDEMVPGAVVVRPQPRPVVRMRVIRNDGTEEFYTADDAVITEQGAQT